MGSVESDGFTLRRFPSKTGRIGATAPSLLEATDVVDAVDSADGTGGIDGASIAASELLSASNIAVKRKPQCCKRPAPRDN